MNAVGSRVTPSPFKEIQSQYSGSSDGGGRRADGNRYFSFEKVDLCRDNVCVIEKVVMNSVG